MSAEQENSPKSPDPNEDTKIDLALPEAGRSQPDPGAQGEPARTAGRAPGGPIEDVALYDVIEPTPAPGAAGFGAPPTPGPLPKVHGRHGDAHTAQIDAPGLLEDFDEDADFSEESVLRDANEQTDADRAALDDTVAEEGWEVFRPAKDAPYFVQTRGRVTIPGIKAPAIVGGVILLLAVAMAFARVQSGAVYAAMGVLYLGLMHSVTGLGAIMIGSLDAKARFGSFAMAWARTLIAVSLLLMISQAPGVRILVVPIAAGAYILALYLLFRWKWRSIWIVAAAHFALWLLLYVGEWLHGAMLSAAHTR